MGFRIYDQNHLIKARFSILPFYPLVPSATNPPSIAIPLSMKYAVFIFILSENNKEKKLRRKTDTLQNELSNMRSSSKWVAKVVSQSL